MTTLDHPCDALEEVHAVASFVSFIADQAGYHDFGNEMSKDDFRGLSVILTWLRDRVAESRENVSQRLEASDMDVLKRAGLPLEALADERLRSAWRAGFSCGATHAGTEVEK